MRKFQNLVLFMTLYILLPTKVHSMTLESKLDCDEPRNETFRSLEITSTHCVDSLGPDEDGLYSYYYDYENIVFRKGNTELSGKRYLESPKEAALIRINEYGNSRLLNTADFQKDIVQIAIEWLHIKGITDIDYLDEENTKSGYTAIPQDDA